MNILRIFLNFGPFEDYHPKISFASNRDLILVTTRKQRQCLLLFVVLSSAILEILEYGILMCSQAYSLEDSP